MASIPTVLDPPIPGNAVVLGYEVDVDTLCNQAVFKYTDGGTVQAGGYNTDFANADSLEFVGVSMAAYSDAAFTDDPASKRRKARMIRTKDTSTVRGGTIPVQVAGTATLSLGYYDVTATSTVPKPGDWVAFDFAAKAAFSGDASTSKKRALKVVKYENPRQKPFGVCVSVARAPRSEITVLLRRDVFQNATDRHVESYALDDTDLATADTAVATAYTIGWHTASKASNASFETALQFATDFTDNTNVDPAQNNIKHKIANVGVADGLKTRVKTDLDAYNATKSVANRNNLIGTIAGVRAWPFWWAFMTAEKNREFARAAAWCEAHCDPANTQRTAARNAAENDTTFALTEGTLVRNAKGQYKRWKDVNNAAIANPLLQYVGNDDDGFDATVVTVPFPPSEGWEIPPLSDFVGMKVMTVDVDNTSGAVNGLCNIDSTANPITAVDTAGKVTLSGGGVEWDTGKWVPVVP